MDDNTKVRLTLESAYLAMLVGLLKVVTLQEGPLLDVLFAAWGL